MIAAKQVRDIQKTIIFDSIQDILKHIERAITVEMARQSFGVTLSICAFNPIRIEEIRKELVSAGYQVRFNDATQLLTIIWV